MDKQDKKVEYIDIRNKSKSFGKKDRTQKTISRGRQALAVTGTVFLSILLILIITFCIVSVALTVYVMQFAENSFDIDLKDVELSMSTFIYAYDEEGNEVELKQLQTDENRVLIDIEELNQHTLDAFVAVEDKRFFEHEGVDWSRTVAVTARAIFSGGTEGGSTITQQLVRDVTQDKKANVGRKLREIFRALSLEDKYTKIDILESYLNRVSFGSTSYGIGSASKHYFDKEAKDLTIAESAILAGLLRSPSNYNPYANLESSRIRQKYALESMYSQGLISTAEYDEALNEKVKFRIPVKGDFYGYTDERYNEYFGIIDGESALEEDLYYENESWDEIKNDVPYKWNGYDVTQSYYVDAAINQIVEDFSESKGISFEAAKEMFYKGGYKAYLNVDLKMQNVIEEKFRDPYTVLTWYNESAAKSDLLQAAFIVNDMRGNVKAVAGGLGEKEGDGSYNRATQSRRSIGSTIKPLSVYSLAIDQNIITYSTMIHDISGEILNPDNPGNRNSRQRWPQNYEEYGYGTGGYYPAWYAVQKSQNTAAVRVLSMVTREASFAQLTNRLGFSTLDPVNDMSWSPLALGALTEGAELIELAAGYQILGNGGMYYKPYFYSKVVDGNGTVILEQDYLGIQAVSPDSAWITNRMVRKVVEDYSGTGRYALLPNVEIIGKTGTNNDMSNLLFAGLTPDYVGVVRIGYDEKKEIAKGSGYKALARIWSDVMVDLIDTSAPKSFVPDSTVLTLSYCTETGLLATSKCPSTNIGYYRQSNVPHSCDSKHDDTYWQTHGDNEGFIPFYP
ncbi:MAG: transglycosylase domain-containing protein [Eubacterium sp.]|jgi:penicillin-binding protein 1A|nr:transglycosylase domain-containing protein [Eubacterium sp.]